MSDRRAEEETVQPPEPEIPEEEDDAIRWDGSEAEMVADEDAEEFEEMKTAVKIRYCLTDQEILRALLHVGLPPRRRILFLVLAVAAFVLAAASFVHSAVQAAPLFLFLGCVCAAAGVFFLVFPWYVIRRRALRENDHKEYTLKIYPDLIEGEHAGKELEIPLDGTSSSEFYKGLALVRYGQNYIKRSGNLLIFPLRSVEPGVLADVEASIRSGTHRGLR